MNTNRRQAAQRNLLYEYIVVALKDQTIGRQLAIATLLDLGEFDVMTEFELGDDGQPDWRTCTYRVDLRCSDGPAPLVSVHYSRLAISDEEAREELALTLAQHGVGIPDDLSSLDEAS